jgi:hypothetical protein
MNSSDVQMYIFVSAIISIFVLYAIIRSAVSGIKKELQKQTHILGLTAVQQGVKADALNEVMEKYK